MSRRERTGRLRFGPFEVDPQSAELYKHGIRLKLHQQPFKVLVTLLENRNAIVTRDQLRAALWPDDTFVAFDKGLDTAIHRLRNALGDSRDAPRFVETLPRRGYRFIAEVEEVFREIPDETIPERPPSRHWLAWAFAALGLTIAVIISVNSFHRRAASPARRVSSLALLPLKNLSGDPSQEYFADGMTEELAADLGKIPGLRVISQASATRYKGTRKSLQEIARELRVDAVVDGAVLRVGPRVKITMHLMEASTDRQLWAQDYDQQLGDIMALQNDVARSIARGIRITFSPDDERRFTRSQTVIPDAYEAYLNGRHASSQWTKDGLGKSIEYFKAAVQKDPTYAPAWAGLSDSYFLAGIFHYVPRSEALAQSKATALKALELDDSLSEAYVALASISLGEWSWSVAESEVRRAVTLDPNNATAHQWYGYLLRAEGNLPDAIAEMKIALELDPLTQNKQQSLGTTLYQAGRYDEALEQFREMSDGDGNTERRHRLLASIYERKGMEREAVAELLKGLRFDGKSDLAASIEHDYLSSGYASAHRHLLSEDLRQTERRAQHADPSAPSVEIAADYALLGDTDKALQVLDQAVQQHNDGLLYLKTDDRFASLHADPRFQNLVRRMGLPL